MTVRPLDFAGPGGVGAVQGGRVGVAVAAGPLAAGGAAGERAGQGEADLAEFGLDLLVAGGPGRPWSQDSLSAAPAASPACLLEVTIFQSWPVLAGKMRRARAGMLPAGRVTGPALRGLSRFADARGVPAGGEFLLDYDVIEAFCVAGLAGRALATRGTYRSALYRLAEAAHGPAGQRATPFPGARAPSPYSPARAGGAGRHRGRPARPGETLLGAGPGGVRDRRGAAARRAGGAARQRRHPARPPGNGSGQRAGRAGGAGHRGLCRPRLGAGPPRGQRVRVPPWPG